LRFKKDEVKLESKEAEKQLELERKKHSRSWRGREQRSSSGLSPSK
jgi:hypothetical protein